MPPGWLTILARHSIAGIDATHTASPAAALIDE
jgi:hypothetical protein